MSRAKPIRLGPAQKGVLRALCEHGYWRERTSSRPGCGWVWDASARTIRILESLVKRGLAVKDQDNTYTPTEEGRKRLS